MSIINSTKNFRVLQWVKYKNKVHRDKKGQFIVEGYHLVSEAQKAGCLKEVITVGDNSNFNVPSYQVTYEVMERITSLATPTKIIGICECRQSTSYGDNILLIDQIHHPGNLGTIIRSAVAFNVDTIILNNSVDIYNQKVVQATRGMLFHINIIKTPIADIIKELKSKDYQIIGTDVTHGIDLHNAKAKNKRAILIGNEGDGVGDDLLNLCDIKVNIKMNSKCESLNVGVAASLVLYELGRIYS